MKKLIFITAAISLFLINSCVDKYELIEPKPEKNGTVFIDSDPDSASIFLLGTETGKVTPDSLTGLETGEYEISLKKENFVDTTFSVQVYSGKTTSAFVEMKKILYHGVIVFESEPAGAEIFSGDSSLGKTTPDSLINLKPGTYTFTFRLANYEDTTFSVVLGKNRRIVKFVQMKKSLTEGSIFVTSQPDSAGIYLDGVATNKITPDTLVNIPKGSHQLTLKRNGYADTTLTVNVVAGEVTNVSVQLRQYVPRGSITIDSNPQGAGIIIDGEPLGVQTPYTIANLLEGNYNLTLTLTGYYDTTFTVQVLRDRNTDVFIEMTPVPPMGSLKIQSDPEGADVYIDNVFSGQQTPAVINQLVTGDHSVTLKLQDFADTTISVNILENLTTEEFVVLRDTTSAVQITGAYDVKTDGQIIFSFSFNQDVRFDSLVVRQPGNPNAISLNYFHQLVLEGIPVEIAFPEKIVGNWTFIFYGNKEHGRKDGFRIVEFINVQ